MMPDMGPDPVHSDAFGGVRGLEMSQMKVSISFRFLPSWGTGAVAGTSVRVVGSQVLVHDLHAKD